MITRSANDYLTEAPPAPQPNPTQPNLSPPPYISTSQCRSAAAAAGAAARGCTDMMMTPHVSSDLLGLYGVNAEAG